MNLPFFIAGRYLFARKSHNVINVISAISAIGMAVGTAALVIILSVYNGFDGLVRSSLSDLDPDILVRPSSGKVFVPDDPAFDWLYGLDEVYSMSSILQDNVFVNYDGRQSVAVAKGVDTVYEEESAVAAHIRQGTFTLHRGEMPLCVVGQTLAYNLGLNPSFVAPLQIYYPARDRSISLTNPLASLESVSARPSGIFAISSDVDASLVILPLETMRELLEYTDEVSGVEIRLAPGLAAREAKALRKELSGRLGESYKVLDRYRQNESLYKMMKYEKAAIFLILIFVIIVIAFNIFGSLSMLIIDKREDMETLRALGAEDGTVRHIFVLEGWLISLLGMMAGLVLGIAFTLLQQRLGIIKMPGGYLVSAYPVILKWTDVLLTCAGVSLTGYLIALIPSSRR